MKAVVEAQALPPGEKQEAGLSWSLGGGDARKFTPVRQVGATMPFSKALIGQSSSGGSAAV